MQHSLKRVFLGLFIAGGIGFFGSTWNGAVLCQDLSSCVGAIGMYEGAFGSSQSTPALPTSQPSTDSDFVQLVSLNLVVLALFGLLAIRWVPQLSRRHPKLRRS